MRIGFRGAGDSPASNNRSMMMSWRFAQAGRLRHNTGRAQEKLFLRFQATHQFVDTLFGVKYFFYTSGGHAGLA